MHLHCFTCFIFSISISRNVGKCFIIINACSIILLFLPQAYADAALSDNSPRPDAHTVTVAPFFGESNICPKNDSLLTPTSFTLSNTSIEVSVEKYVNNYLINFITVGIRG